MRHTTTPVEVVGYAARAYNATQTPNWGVGPYVIQSLLLLLAPSLFSASIYMILGRIVRLVNGESRSLIRPSWLTKIFVTGDVLSFFIQSGGAIYSTLIFLFGRSGRC
jgi:RTA1 like protein